MKKLFFISLCIINITSCSFSYEGTSNFLTDVQTIDGIEYYFSAMTRLKNMEIIGAKSIRIESKIMFQGLNKTIDMMISDSDFSKKIKRKKLIDMKFEKVSFLMNEEKNKIDLYYVIDIEDNKDTISFTLFKVDDNWSIN
ncbi:hypothetical protein [Carboxylicivirga caseinilyticus]|uniref:hypothetical protein n=1 Tax=Carboxylicivirga caseinilyticus TaxID=3417572 RepID=UPI003D32A1B1|nr:hypothetical protein [Marinilabiliaceae bacterium A049]